MITINHSSFLLPFYTSLSRTVFTESAPNCSLNVRSEQDSTSKTTERRGCWLLATILTISYGTSNIWETTSTPSAPTTKTTKKKYLSSITPMPNCYPTMKRKGWSRMCCIDGCSLRPRGDPTIKIIRAEEQSVFNYQHSRALFVGVRIEQYTMIEEINGWKMVKTMGGGISGRSSQVQLKTKRAKTWPTPFLQTSPG